MKRIAALVPNKLGVSPGQRLRIEAWAEYLKTDGWKIDFYPFEDDSLHEVFYSRGNTLVKSKRILSCYLRQARTLLRNIECDGIFLYREASLIGPAFLERMAFRSNVPTIYDIDDPVFLPYRSPVNGWLSLLKFSRKTHKLFRMSDHVIAINSLIGDYARKFNESVTVIPNFVDTKVFVPNAAAKNGTAKIVWTGSISTLQNLESIAEPIGALQKKYEVPFRVVANGEAALRGVRIEHVAWSPEAEIRSLQDCDIGVVPLLDLEWNPWKFYLKTIQYMAVGLPVVAAKTGSNAEVIKDGVNGFLVESRSEWYEKLGVLIENRELRLKMGQAARRTAVAKYSVEAQMPRVVNLFESVYGR